jgi:hypothetical protein
MCVPYMCALYVCLYVRRRQGSPSPICSIQVPFICARCAPCMCPVLSPLHVPLMCSSKPTLATFCPAGSLSVPLICAPYGCPCTCINASALIKTQIYTVKPMCACVCVCRNRALSRARVRARALSHSLTHSFFVSRSRACVCARALSRSLALSLRKHARIY